MKKTLWTSFILVLMSFTTMAQDDQIKLMNKYLGAWQANRGKDTIEVWDYKPYGSQAFIVDIYQIVKGKKIPVSFNPISYNPMTGKFYGFTLLANGYYGTWVGSFTSETKFDGDMLANFNPEPVYGKIENTFTNPNEWHCLSYTNEGVKFADLHFTKVR
ncbi:MAG TPA: hypothetical protein VHI78_04745 [Bacteroidales bacterium]|jgi:hypothetical protein|nr:hypothetical protein [Bacteroidales bacterium]